MSAVNNNFSKAVTAATRRVTGTLFCSSGKHHVPVEKILRMKPRPVCGRCELEIEKRRAKR